MLYDGCCQSLASVLLFNKNSLYFSKTYVVIEYHYASAGDRNIFDVADEKNRVCSNQSLQRLGMITFRRIKRAQILIRLRDKSQNL